MCFLYTEYERSHFRQLKKKEKEKRKKDQMLDDQI